MRISVSTRTVLQPAQRLQVHDARREHQAEVVVIVQSPGLHAADCPHAQLTEHPLQQIAGGAVQVLGTQSSILTALSRPRSSCV